ncbi:MAG: TetR/AcrR family transcriptional regulator [Aquabacterium sp.]|nr:MAG: TetR/AcrR family transcriptional regulator [Aquabacterium sp.]
MSTPLQTRAQILQAAGKLLLAQGLDATSMEQVRRAAGVSNGSLYHHFPTKPQLAQAVYDDALGRYHAALLPALSNAQGTPLAAEAGVRALVSAHLEWVVAQPQAAAVLHRLRHTPAVAEAEPEIGQRNAGALAVLGAWMRSRVEAGELADLPLPVWIALVFAPALQLTAGWLRQQPPSIPPDLRRRLADAAWRAVAP